MLDEELCRLRILRGGDALERMEVEPANVEAIHMELGAQPLRLLEPLLHILRDERVKCFHRLRKEVGIRPLRQEVEPREPRLDIERDAGRGRSAREPRPKPPATPREPQLLKALFLLVRQTVGGEEFAKPRAGCAFVCRLTDPRRRFKRNRLEVFIRLKRALQRFAARRLPRVERGADARIGVCDVLPQRIRVVAAERLLAAFVRELHQVRKRQHRVPRRTRHGAYCEILVADRLGPFARQQVLEPERLRRVTAHVELHGLTHHHAPRQYRQHALFAVCKRRAFRARDIFEIAAPIRDPHRELERLRFVRREGKWLRGGVGE